MGEEGSTMTPGDLVTLKTDPSRVYTLVEAYQVEYPGDFVEAWAKLQAPGGAVAHWKIEQLVLLEQKQ
jgi:hypothetical protein